MRITEISARVGSNEMQVKAALMTLQDRYAVSFVPDRGYCLGLNDEWPYRP